jgi:hypothetical protein
MESSAVSSAVRESLSPPDGTLIRTANLWKTYDMGAVKVDALCGVSFEIQRG